MIQWDRIKNTSRGFTIVELLIVIVVIGILAAIVIVAFNGVQGRAHDVAVTSDLKSSYQKIEMYRLKNGSYPKSTTIELATEELKASTGSYATDVDYNFAYCPPNPIGSSSTFGMVAKSKSGKTIYYDESGAHEYVRDSSNWRHDWTMNDYVSLCLNITDKSNAFVWSGTSTSNDTSDYSCSIVTQPVPGWKRTGANQGWRAWAGGTVSSSAAC